MRKTHFLKPLFSHPVEYSGEDVREVFEESDHEDSHNDQRSSGITWMKNPQTWNYDSHITKHSGNHGCVDN